MLETHALPNLKVRNYFQFGIFWGGVNFFLCLPIIYVISLIVPKAVLGKTASTDYFSSDPSAISLIFFVILFFPLFETLIVQLITIEILRKLSISSFICIAVSSILFSFGHYANGGLAHGLTALCELPRLY
ncbi:type II CAAX prenyl endopeptidase Rce1 family protein [Undibacterium sp. Xuan67W]|uniref:CPBP family glutamic-type intramembrane protease n=1 Tax=Undibacterium sp. Xuan67W TaxID=3413057 RepID=UPI003BF028CF